MATYTLTPQQLKGVGVYNSFEIPAGGGGGFVDTTSLLYDGLDDYQESSAWSTIDGTGEFTVSMWIKLDSIASPTRLISGYTGVGTAANLYLNVGTDGMVEGWSGGSGTNWSRSVVGAITTGVWYHIALRLADPSVNRYYRQKIFINGVWSNGSSNYYGGTIPNGTTLAVGANYNYSHPAYFYPTNGNINEVAIWGSNALTDTQILEIYNGGTANDLKTLPTAPNPTNWYRSENANWVGGSYYSTSDEMGNGAKLLTRNMAEASRVTDVPPNPFTNTKSILLDGVDDWVSVLNNNTIARTQNISYSIWVKLVDGATRQYLVGNWTSSNGGTGLSIETSNTLVFQLGDGTNDSYFNSRVTNFTTYAPNNTWNHILATWDGNDAKIYINGILRNTWTPTNLTISNWSAFWIGRRDANGNDTTYGNLDEVSIFNNDQSANVSSIFNQGVPNDISGMNGLVSWWRMGDGSIYPTINDEIGSNDGTMTNMTSANFVNDVPPTFNINSFLFDGVDDIFKGSSIYSEMDGGTKLTLSVWLKPIAGSPKLEYVLSNPRNLTANEHQFALVLFESNTIAFDVQSRTSQFVSGRIGAINYGVWNHVLVCIDLNRTIGTEGLIFINGVDETTQSAMGTFSSFYTASGVLHIGVDANGGYNRFNGNIDELSIWSGSDLRSASDVSSIYNSGVPSDLNDTSGIPTPTTYFRMGEQSTFGSQWSMTDINGSYVVDSNNMALANRTNDIP